MSRGATAGPDEVQKTLGAAEASAEREFTVQTREATEGSQKASKTDIAQLMVRLKKKQERNGGTGARGGGDQRPPAVELACSRASRQPKRACQ